MENNALGYTSADIFKAAEMDKKGFYIVVEGNCDKPIFSELLNQLKEFGIKFNKPIIGSGGGKPNILKWLEVKKSINVKVILDRDFDCPHTDINDPRIIPLDVYSVENYYFTVDVIAPQFANLTNSTIDETCTWLDLSPLIQNWSNELRDVVAVLYYYQKVYLKEKISWGDTDIIKNREQWEICAKKANRLKSELLTKMNSVTIDDCITAFNKSNIQHECMSICFPGKLIKKSFYRYLKFHCEQNGGNFSSLSNIDHLMQSLNSRLIRNASLRAILERVIA